jgi:heme exporter protein B
MLPELLRDAGLIAAKDLRIEARARVVVHQLAPFTLLVLVLFGFALDADSQTLRSFTPGLYWVSVLLAALLAVQRAADVETADGATQGLLLSGIEPAAVFLGKALGLWVQLLVLEVLLSLGVVVLYGASFAGAGGVVLYAATALVATSAVAGAGTLYGALAAGLGARETILPVLMLPVLAPVLIGATRAFDDALGTVAVNGWAWFGLLGAMTIVFVTAGSLVYGVLLEEA